MKEWWARFKEALKLQRWPVHDPADIKKKERVQKLNRLYNKND